ncbi:MAG: hypothetical protein IK018_08445 [Lachnospiraceae bacterium]|nr:hypothetical protein [Lachnospiraceae bacterium]MBR5762117.1 hypothetical protein [Lachnospiraceae bacterium]MBR5993821.1 hypothetical protein [Lachnospiraceae bacterium]
MSFFNGTFYSTSLSRPVHFTAVLSNDIPWPMGDNPNFKRPTKNVYLLHGYSGCDTDWFTNAPLGELANRFNVNFFMPNGDNSFYLNQPQTGFKYQDYVGKEFVEYTRKTFGLSDKREDTIIGGLSMGGFGTLHTALAYPETFSKALALSSALIVHGMKNIAKEDTNVMANYEYYAHTFGDFEKLEESDNNPEVLAKRLVDTGAEKPEIYMACGTEDFLIEPNRAMKAYFDSIGYPATFFTGPGIHDFVFWRAQLERGLEWALEGKHRD